MTECKHGGKVKTDGGNVKCLTCIHDDAWKESALAENKRVLDAVEKIDIGFIIKCVEEQKKWKKFEELDAKITGHKGEFISDKIFDVAITKLKELDSLRLKGDDGK